MVVWLHLLRLVLLLLVLLHLLLVLLPSLLLVLLPSVLPSLCLQLHLEGLHRIPSYSSHSSYLVVAVVPVVSREPEVVVALPMVVGAVDKWEERVVEAFGFWQ